MIFKSILQWITSWWEFGCNEGWVPLSIKRLGWSVKIRSIQEEFSKICVGFDISFLKP